jgi:hypothetical protein
MNSGSLPHAAYLHREEVAGSSPRGERVDSQRFEDRVYLSRRRIERPHTWSTGDGIDVNTTNNGVFNVNVMTLEIFVLMVFWLLKICRSFRRVQALPGSRRHNPDQ